MCTYVRTYIFRVYVTILHNDNTDISDMYHNSVNGCMLLHGELLLTLQVIHLFKLAIRGIIGKSNICQFALKMQLMRFLIGGFDYCMERNPCLQPKWRTFNLAMSM